MTTQVPSISQRAGTFDPARASHLQDGGRYARPERKEHYDLSC